MIGFMHGMTCRCPRRFSPLVVFTRRAGIGAVLREGALIQPWAVRRGTAGATLFRRVHPYDEVEWERRDLVMTNRRDSSVDFEQRGIEFPDL
ncbi:hypothetical protein [Streptomyces sp. NPDC101776]|uniref:hypothetical protein n=1 Tax=Streptomyces sp. NPDC101776 TaxID=3366146 RepID=UPI0037F2D934